MTPTRTGSSGSDGKEADAADRLSRLLFRDDQQFFVADLDGRAAGWVHVVFAEYVDAEAFVVIGGLVVDRNHRQLGIGGALMNRAEVWAKARGCSMVRLSSSATRKGDFDYLLGDWEFTADSKEYGKHGGYWSAVRLAEGQVLDEYSFSIDETSSACSIQKPNA